MKHAFTLEYWQDDGWYVGKLKKVPGVFSQGETLQELEENIDDAYKLLMEEEQPIDRSASQFNDLFAGIEDPAAWQREIRKDRPLPGREE